ncbi:MAG: glutathione synthase [Deltaproteobacteria bacterium]|nr:glutathione synthase [Deltaproteobacteria bacterium]
MIVSFHPLFEGDINILCAGRDPGPEELAAIRSAAAVILPQGCTRPLFEMARQNCGRVFPNYDARFRYPGKTGQIRLFRETGMPHPVTALFAGVADYRGRHEDRLSPGLPCVFKFDWGGEGDTVFLVHSQAELEELLQHAAACEATGQRGFLLQEYIACGNRSLRVAVIGERVVSYWRICDGHDSFRANVSKGASIDTRSDPALKGQAERMVGAFCQRTGIDLAGIDVIFDMDGNPPRPLLLEINYYFGRVGLGGAEAYYRILAEAIRTWLDRIGVPLLNSNRS